MADFSSLHHWLYRRYLDLRILNPLFHVNKYKEKKLDEWVKEKVSEICFEHGGYEIETDEIDNGYIWYHLGDKGEKVYEVNVFLWTNYPVSRKEFEQFMEDVSEDITKLLETKIKEKINRVTEQFDFVYILVDSQVKIRYGKNVVQKGNCKLVNRSDLVQEIEKLKKVEGRVKDWKREKLSL